MKKKECIKCGRMYSESSHYCSRCGTPVIESDETERKVGEEVYFRGTINAIRILPNGKELYQIREWPDIAFEAKDFKEESDGYKTENTMEYRYGEVKTENKNRIMVLKGYDTTDLVDELEMREGVSSILVGPSNKTDIKVDGPAVVLIVVD